MKMKMRTSKTQFLLVLMFFISSFRPTFEKQKFSQTSIPLTLVRLSEASAFRAKADRMKHVPQSSSSPRAVKYPPLPFQYPSMALIASLQIGTPSQSIQMVLDTGSQLTLMACDLSNQKASFQHKYSSSFSYVPCNNNKNKKQYICPVNDNTLGESCDSSHRCTYLSSYADGTFAEGNLVKENIAFSASQTTPPLILGCTSKADSSGAEGILGMNLGPLSFISQLGVQTFSYCVPNHGNKNAGTLYLGAHPKSVSFQYVYLSKTPPYHSMPNYNRLAYSLPLVAIHISGRRLPVPEVNPNGSGQTIIDSGTQYTYLDDVVYKKLEEKVLKLMNVLKLKRRSYKKLKHLCFNGNSEQNRKKLGDIVFEFGNNVSVLISKGKLFDEVSRNVSCFTIKSSDTIYASYNIIGNFLQQNLWVEYDVKNKRVGFGNTYCNK